MENVYLCLRMISWVAACVQGEDVREGDSPSWFNPAETVQVVRYLQGLLGNNPPLSPDHIGIITPYRKQVRQAVNGLFNRGEGRYIIIYYVSYKYISIFSILLLYTL